MTWLDTVGHPEIMGTVGYILIGAFGLWYLAFPGSVIRLHASMSLLKKKEKGQPTPVVVRVIGGVILLLLAALWVVQRAE